jgi:hypothetical protein
MTVALAPDHLARLVKLLGKLGSAHPGERDAAAVKATELLAAHQLSWADLLHPPVQAVADAGPRTWRVCAEEVLTHHYAALFQPREVEFLAGLLERARAPSPKQAAWLGKIAARCGVPRWEGCT